ncbi:SPOR domain-containing protein [Pseudoxanthomonas sacheonensis]|uniref:SPOR domain-containing protein n=1 Tax=Pseudoxanthomonas sacheonensis TaxID=443615 RepID=UPI0013D00287|nr:SPOR domain-containing protein [Pseudoxanthomonas sacheonensis]KAF1710840.1 sporulation protein [Pseudoxanthomonas sacheonensis]
MAARRNKSQARRNSGNGTPGWVWLIAGLVLGAAAFFIVPGLMKKDGDGFFRPQPNPDALPAQVADADSNIDDVAPETSTPTSQPDAKTGDDAAKETQYDFYTLLPGKEVQMSDAELAASAREEKAREARAAQAAAATAAATTPAVNTATDNPKPVPETPAAAATTAPAVAATATATAPAISSAPTSKDARYILQAGAFGASGDAESTKAKIAMLGLSARVESAQIGGKTVYRVRMGPYGSASELAEAKQKLASGGLPAMAIKAQ